MKSLAIRRFFTLPSLSTSILLLMVFLFLFGSTRAQYVIPPNPTSNSIFQDFNTLPSSGSVAWSDLVTIPFWYMQRTPVAGGTGPFPITLYADDGNNLTGNGYAYGTGVSSERALGSVGSNNANSGHYAWGIQFQNTTGFVVSDFKVSYKGEQWRDGGVSSVQIIKFYYKSAAAAITNLQPSISAGWTSVGALNFTCLSNTGVAQALDGNSASYSSLISSPVNGLSLSNNQYLMMKWDDPKYSGATDHGMSTDDVTVSWVVCSTPTTQASSIAAVTVNQNDIDLQWTNGSGSGRYVVINTVNSFTNPVDGVAYPVPNPTYSGSGEQVVFAGTGNAITVDGLQPCTVYYFRVFEYNCSGANIHYTSVTATDNPAPVSTSMANLPTVFTISGNSAYCTGDPNVNINLSGSQLGVNYQLYLDGNPVGAAVPGTGNPMTITYAPVTAGTYTVVATYGTAVTCVSNMTGAITVTVSPSPVAASAPTATPDHICGNSGGTIQLSASGGSGTTFEWYSGACGTGGTLVGSTQTLSIPAPLSTTTYYGRWTTPTCGSTGCVSVTVTVDDPPTPSAAGPDQGICGSLAATLAANPAAVGTGSWSTASGPGTINYTNPASNTTTISASVIGIYSLVWTITNGSLCPASRDTVIINFSDALTVSPSSNTPVCSGNDLYLYSDIGGAVYNWTGPNGFTSNQQNPVINACTTADAGTYTVAVSSIPGGCPNTTNSTVVVVNPSATPAGSAASVPASICTGSTGNLLLSVPGGSGDTLVWYSGSCGGTRIGVGNNLPIPYPAATTTYYAQWLSNDCGPATCDQVTVNVVNPPNAATATNISICNATSTTLNGNNPTSGTGLWTCTGGPGTYTFSNPSAFNSTFSVSTMGIYNLSWTISTGTECAPSVANITVEFSNTVTVTVTATSPACEGDTIFLTSSVAGATYVWSGPNGFSSTLQNPIVPNVIPAHAGTYTVTVDNIPGGCPQAIGSTVVSVTGKPATPAIAGLNISGNTQIACLGSPAPYAYTVGPAAGSTYTWTLTGGGTLSSIPGSSQAAVNWTSPGGPYVLSVVETSASGCDGNAVILNVTVNTPPTIVLPLDTVSATNGQANGELNNVVANGSGPFDYSVDGGAWGTQNSFTGLLPGNHTLQVQDANGCISSQPFVIGNSFMGIMLNGDTITACPGTSININILASGMANIMDFDLCLTYDENLMFVDGTPTYNPAFVNVNSDFVTAGQLYIFWDGSSPVTLAAGELLCTLKFRGKQSGTGYIRWEDFLPGICGMHNDAGVKFVVSFVEDGAATFRQRPVAEITGDTTLCLGETIDLVAAGDPTLNYVWTLPDNSQITGPQYTSAQITASAEGPYYLLVTDADGCINKDTVNVTVSPAPQISMVNGPHLLCADAYYEFKPGEGYVSYLWWDNSTLPENAASGEGIYWVVVEDENGCTATDTVELVYCPAALRIPNAFTPDGDGLNEVFRARYTDSDQLEGFKMMIYSRTGELLFETNNINQGWDGYFNGVLCPPGVYTWYINFRKPTGKTFPDDPPYRGLVTLVR